MNKLLIDILISIVNVMNFVILVRFYNNIFHSKKISNIVRNLAFFILLAVLIVINLLFSQLSILFLLVSLINILIGLFFYEAKTYVIVIVALFFVMFTFLSELIAAVLLSFLFDGIIQNARDNSMYMFLGGLISKIIMLILIELIIRFKNEKRIKVSISSWLAILTIPVLSIILSIICVYNPVIERNFSIVSGISCLVILYINMVTFYLFDNIIAQVDDNIQYKTREQIMKSQEDQYKVTIDGYNQIMKIKHDMINHLISIDAFIEDNDIKVAKDYIRILSEELDLSKRNIISGNVVIDAIINNRENVINKNGIVFSHEITIPSNLKIDNIDLSVLLGNLLNNSIESCLRNNTSKTSNEIILNMKYLNEALFIDIRNSFDPATIRKFNGKYVSSKEHRKSTDQGIGLGNIEEIVEKYKGVFKIDMNENEFITKLMLPEKKTKE